MKKEYITKQQKWFMGGIVCLILKKKKYYFKQEKNTKTKIYTKTCKKLTIWLLVVLKLISFALNKYAD